MSGIEIEPKRPSAGLSFRFRTLNVWAGVFELRVYLKWSIWLKKYHFRDFARMNASNGFALMAWPFEFVFRP